MDERETNYEEIGLCPHGRLPGICEECGKTAEVAPVEGGSEIAIQLEKETGIKPYDVLMVLGAGFSPEVKPNGDETEEEKRGWRLNKESRMRLIGAAQLYLEGRTRFICLTGGHAISEKYKDFPSLAELGKNFLMKKFGIPEKDIIFEDESDATHGNLAHGLRSVYEKHIPVGEFAILSTNYHLNRAREMAKRMGIVAHFLPTESELLGRSPHYRKFVANWLRYAQEKGLEANEIEKLKDDGYWEDRAAVFETPLDQPVPSVDISKSVADTAKRLTESGAKDGQTSSF